MRITTPEIGVIPAFEMGGRAQPQTVSGRESGFPKLRVYTHPGNPIQYSQIKVFIPDPNLIFIPNCFCLQSPCSRLCFVILTDECQDLNIHAIDQTSTNYPNKTSVPGDQFTYLIRVPIHPGVNIVFWCAQTIFFHPESQEYNTSPTFSLSINLIHLKVYQLSSQNVFTPSQEKFIHPFPMDDSSCPSVATVFRNAPPLWALCRLSLGVVGVIPGGLGVVDKKDREAVPSHWWEVHRVQLINYPDPTYVMVDIFHAPQK